MKKERQDFKCTPDFIERSRVTFFFVIFSILFSMKVSAQIDTVNVPGDVPPGEGNLNKAITAKINAGTLSNTVFKLESNGYYILTGTIIVPAGKHLTIVAVEPGQTQETAPPQIVWSSNKNVNPGFNFDCYGDITLKNIWLLYANTSGWQVGSSLQIEDDPAANASGKGEIGVFENVIFDYSGCPQNSSGAVGVSAKHFNGTFKNCYFKNCIDSHFRYYGRAVSFPYNSPGWHIDNISFENCTFANLGYVYEQESTNYTDNVKFNHCTFLNVVVYPLESGWWNKLSVTNSIFVNCQMIGNTPALTGTYDPYGGTLMIDSVASFGFSVPFNDQDRKILFASSSYFIEKWLSNWMYNNPQSVQWRNEGMPEMIPQPQPMLSPGTLNFFDSVVNGKKVFPFINRADLHDSTDPGFILAPSDTSRIKNFLYIKWSCCSDSNWAYFPEFSLQRIWPMKENLAYTNHVLLTGGMSGFPMGDLYRWFPEKYTQWKLQKDKEDDRILNWLNTGLDPLISSAKDQSGSIVNTKFMLMQNYPNPFNPITKIEYSIQESGYISLKIYNLLGEEITTLFEGFQNIGNYIAEFNGNELASGVYLCRFKVNSFVETKKLVLLK